jgi:hypothetical protein
MGRSGQRAVSCQGKQIYYVRKVSGATEDSHDLYRLLAAGVYLYVNSFVSIYLNPFDHVGNIISM